MHSSRNKLEELIRSEPRPSDFFLASRGTMQSLNQNLINQNFKVWDFINFNLRGIGQVVFVNNPISGLLILVALFIQSPWVGSMSLLGGVSSTYTAIALDLDKNNLRNGIYGYNGVLVGTAIATFGLEGNGGWNFVWVFSVAFFSSLTTILLKITGSWWSKRIKSPFLTLPFNAITFLFLSWAKYNSQFEFGRQETISNISSSVNITRLISVIFTGFGQIFLADKLIVGFLIFLAIALCTPIGAIVGLSGSIIGMLTGLIWGGGTQDLYLGLWSYNSILGAMAIGGVFYVPNQRSFIVALGCACFSALIGMLSATLLEIFSLPILTLPFCFATICIFVVFEKIFPCIVPVSLNSITNPEEHRQRYLDAKCAIFYFRFQLERFMLGYSSNFWFDHAEIKVKKNLAYAFDSFDIEHKHQISIQKVKLYLNETGQIYSPEILEYLTRFIDINNKEKLNYEEFGELILRHEYVISKHEILIDYFLPIGKQKNNLVSLEEINKTIMSTGHTPLTKSQVNLLQQRTRTINWTWNQFILVILAV